MELCPRAPPEPEGAPSQFHGDASIGPCIHRGRINRKHARYLRDSKERFRRSTCPDRSTFGRLIWEGVLLVDLVGRFSKLRELIAMGWLCKTVHMSLKERLSPLKGTKLTSLEHLREMTGKYRLKERLRFTRPGYGWRLCVRYPPPPGYTSWSWGPVTEKEYLHRRAAIAVSKSHPMRLTTRYFGVFAWPDCIA